MKKFILGAAVGAAAGSYGLLNLMVRNEIIFEETAEATAAWISKTIFREPMTARTATYLKNARNRRRAEFL